MKKDWILRVKGRHSIAIYNDGEVRYSVGKRKLFILKKDALQELESLVKLRLSEPSDSTSGNIIRFKDENNKIFTLCNRELYTAVWKTIYDAESVKGNIEELKDFTNLIDYVINYGDPVSEVPLDKPDPSYLNKILDMDVYTDSLVNIILTKNNEIYY